MMMMMIMMMMIIIIIIIIIIMRIIALTTMYQPFVDTIISELPTQRTPAADAMYINHGMKVCLQCRR
jgi:hypothetical protein